ncbi:DUF6308 family protein [Nocardia sp. PE-7]|uniref:DUF6308 family protein n=1 Tax=Nocardia sp. PE-7 TaxID=3058426 RepID=UPI002657BF6B|nr:DUF6308 family protein [Nocardia sp. PE-7]WKG12436.1 DUF6308 family protein [Nocardia sp. PE-7]
MRPVVRWTLPTELEHGQTAAAAALLRTYFCDVEADGSPRYSGAAFERFGGGGDRSEIANVFTAEDVVAVSMLNVRVPGSAALRMLERDRAGLSSLLGSIPADLDLVDAEIDILDEDSPADRLWRALRSVGVGPVTTSKLLARKRPRLLPVVKQVLDHPDRHSYWMTLRSALRDDERALVEILAAARIDAGLGEDISLIRCFDVVVWMVGRRDVQFRRHGRY